MSDSPRPSPRPLVPGEWAEAGNGSVHHLLGPGWSGHEPWGVWGVGAVHEFLLPLIESPAGDIVLEADVHVVLLGPRDSQLVDVEVAGQRLATWEFSRETNGARRDVRIPAALVVHAVGSDDAGTLHIAFRPRFVASPAELDPTVSDIRTLGLGLQRVRWQTAERVAGDAPAGGKAITTAAGARTMNVAAITFVYNESVNLPIWIGYFGKLFGRRNLFVIDLGTTDGSTDNLGEVNLLRVPRKEFDEYQKTGIINSLQQGLLNYFDTVIYTDCDELVVPDLSVYADLNDYLARKEFECVSCVGLNVQHMISIEDPLDLSKPILAQRRFARFLSSTCKPAVTRVPLTWANGLHHCDRRPRIDPELFMIHTKWMDYSLAMIRQKISREARYSERTVTAQLGAHSRYDSERFVREGFFDPVNVMHRDGLAPFDFTAEIAAIEERTVEHDGTYLIPMDIVKYVELPDYLRTAF